LRAASDAKESQHRDRRYCELFHNSLHVMTTEL